MIDRVFQYIRQYHMVDPGDVIITGVSGGADSVCLLFVLQKLAERLGVTIEVVHVNHGIRAEAGEDAEFVRGLCDQLGVPFHLFSVDVEARAREEKCSTEEMGRKLRYEAFQKVLGSRKGKIAVAHNSNDRAETMLFHLFRGTGLAGACGIRPVQGSVIRPLLFLERKEIEQWLGQQGISFCTDRTNLEDDYTRNRIRHHILTYAEQEIAHGVVASMNRAAVQLQEADEYIMRQTGEALERCCIYSEEHQAAALKIDSLLHEDPYIRKYLLFQVICQVAGRKKDITEAHVLSVCGLLQGEGNKEVMLPYQLRAVRRYGWLRIEKRVAKKEMSQEEYPELLVEIPSVIPVPGLGEVEFQVFPSRKTQIIPQKTYTKWFDYDKITASLFLRPRKPGDYLTINQQMGHKSLQDYLVDQKIPKENRNSLYVLAMDHHVVWVPGLRISEYFKISEHTENILQVRVLGKC